MPFKVCRRWPKKYFVKYDVQNFSHELFDTVGRTRISFEAVGRNSKLKFLNLMNCMNVLQDIHTSCIYEAFLYVTDLIKFTFPALLFHPQANQSHYRC